LSKKRFCKAITVIIFDNDNFSHNNRFFICVASFSDYCTRLMSNQLFVLMGIYAADSSSPAGFARSLPLPAQQPLLQPEDMKCPKNLVSTNVISVAM
jgi:hypothetical protein